MSGNGILPGVPTSQAWQAITEDHDAQRMQRYQEALEFFDGNQWEGRRRGNETRLVINYARTVLRKAIRYMYHEPPTFQVIDERGRQSEMTELAHDVLDRIYEHNQLDDVDPATAVDASVLGDGAFKVTWSAIEGQVIIAPVDPQGLYAWWHPLEPTRLVRVVQRRRLTRDEVHLMGYTVPAGFTSETALRSGTVTLDEEWTSDSWRVAINNQVVEQRSNPYGWVPYVIFPNERRPHSRWGMSDLVDLYEVCRELNRRISTVANVLELSGHPIAVLENVTGSDGIRTEPGSVWELPEDSKAYLLDLLSGGGVQLHIEYLDRVWRSLHDLSETPRTTFGDSGRSLSGVALEVEVQPLSQKVGAKRRVWTRVYRERNAMALELAERFGGQPVGGLRRTRVEWGSTLPADREALVREMQLRVSAGLISRRAAIEQLGDEDAVALLDEWIAEARRIAGELEVDDGDASGDQDAGSGSAGGDQRGDME